MSSLTVGQVAPDFTLPDQDGNPVSLAQFSGQVRVVYFYPKASTPGCTTQACGLRDTQAELRKLGVQVLGISPDAPAKIKKFVDKYALNFTLLGDEDHKVAEAYGVWGLKKFMGREFMGILRTTFVVDSSGKIAYIMDKVNTKTHDQDVLNILKNVI